MPAVSRSMRLTDRGIYWVLATLLAAAGLIPEFRSLGNLANVATQSAALAVLAVGQTFVILCGLIDLSIGQLTGLIVVLVCDVAAGRDAMMAPALLLAMGLGAGSGAVTGLLNNRLRIHPLILTFGTMSVLQGIVFSYTDRSVGRAPAAIAWLADGRLLGLPVAPLLVLVLAARAHVTLPRTRLGVHVRTVGGGRAIAKAGVIDKGRVVGAVVHSL